MCPDAGRMLGHRGAQLPSSAHLPGQFPAGAARKTAWALLGWGRGRLQLEAVGLGSAGAHELGSAPSPEPAQPSPPTPSWCARHLRQRRAGLLSGFYLLWVFPSDSQGHKNPPRLLVPGALAVPRCPLSPGPPHAVQHRPCSAACGDTDGRGSPWQT